MPLLPGALLLTALAASSASAAPASAALRAPQSRPLLLRVLTAAGPVGARDLDAIAADAAGFDAELVSAVLDAARRPEALLAGTPNEGALRLQVLQGLFYRPDVLRAIEEDIGAAEAERLGIGVVRLSLEARSAASDPGLMDKAAELAGRLLAGAPSGDDADATPVAGRPGTGGARRLAKPELATGADGWTHELGQDSLGRPLVRSRKGKTVASHSSFVDARARLRGPVTASLHAAGGRVFLSWTDGEASAFFVLAGGAAPVPLPTPGDEVSSAAPQRFESFFTHRGRLFAVGQVSDSGVLKRRVYRIEEEGLLGVGPLFHEMTRYALGDRTLFAAQGMDWRWSLLELERGFSGYMRSLGVIRHRKRRGDGPLARVADVRLVDGKATVRYVDGKGGESFWVEGKDHGDNLRLYPAEPAVVESGYGPRGGG